MATPPHAEDDGSRDWLRADPRVFGRLLAAQNVLFVLPDERRIAEYFSQSLSGIPGVIACSVRLGEAGGRADTPSPCDPPADAPAAEPGDVLDVPVRVGVEPPLGVFHFSIRSSAELEPYSRSSATSPTMSPYRSRTAGSEGSSSSRTESSRPSPIRSPTICGRSVRSSASPSSSTKGYRGVLDEEGQRYVRFIREGGQRMQQLITDILAFSRMGRSPMGAEQVDMTALAGEVYAELRAGEAQRQVRFVLDPLPPVVGDRAMLRQVWSNLLGNALKYTARRAEPEILVFGAVEHHELVYGVKDNGAGFDMQYADKLFGVFQRLHTSAEFEGTGIGLAIVRRIVERHGGRVWGEGEVDRGATFRFALPVCA